MARRGPTTPDSAKWQGFGVAVMAGLCLAGVHGAQVAAPATPDAPWRLTVNDRVDPVGVDSVVFGWFPPATMTQQWSASVSLAHAITGAPVWSGQAATNVSAIAYPATAPALNGTTPYVWTVTVSGLQVGGAAPVTFNTSQPATFVTGAGATLQVVAQPMWHANSSAEFTFHLLQTQLPTRAHPIVAAYAFATANPQPSVQGEVENAKLLGAYKLYLNDQLIGLGPGRPGRCGPVCPIHGDPLPCTCTPEQVYDGFNVTDAVQAGQPLSVALQCFNYAPTGGVLNQTSKVLASLVVWYADGAVVHVGTGLPGPDGARWVSFNADPYYNASCCTSDHSWYLQPAENVITALEPVGWRAPGFAPSAPAWTPSALQPPFTVALTARPSEPASVAVGVPAASWQQIAPGHWFIDYGREFQVREEGAGGAAQSRTAPGHGTTWLCLRLHPAMRVCLLRVQGGMRLTFETQAAGAGTQVWVRWGEELASVDPPAVLYDMRTTNQYVSVITLRAGTSVVEQHEYVEFRFAEVVAVVPPPAACVQSAPADYTTPVTLSCGAGGTITGLQFADWGTPTGHCTGLSNGSATNDFAVNASCTYPDTATTLAPLCVGKESCTFVPSVDMFGGKDPCHYVEKWVAVAAECSGGGGPASLPWSLTAVESWVLTNNDASYVVPSSPLLPPAAQSNQLWTSDADLNAVWSFCRYTVIATGAPDMYTDSNTRQRSVICAESFQINLLMQYATSTERNLQTYTLDYFANSRPSDLGWAEWQAMHISHAWLVWQHTGSLAPFLRHQAHFRYFTELSLISATTGLWTCDGADTFACNKPEVDWPPAMRDGFVFVPADTVVNAYTYVSWLRYAAMTAAAGNSTDAEWFAMAAAALRSAINAQLYNASCGCYVDGLTTGHTAWHSSLFALTWGVPTADMVPAVLQFVIANSIGQPELCQPGNVYPAQWLLEVLFTHANDYGSTGVEVLRCNGTAGWLAMLRQNATTTMEAWNPADKPNLTWSHSWAASPADIMPRWMLGVRPEVPGFSSLVVQPQLGDVAAAAGCVPTPMGWVCVNVTQTVSAGTRGAPALWRARPNVAAIAPTATTLRVSIPGTVVARVCLPVTACTGGVVTLDGVGVQGEVDGAWVCVGGVTAGGSGGGGGDGGQWHTAQCASGAA